MKTSIKTITAAIALTALIAGPAAAMVSNSKVTQDVSSVLGSGSNVFVTVEGDTVTLRGYVESRSDKNAAFRAAKANTGIDHVVDRIIVTN